MSRFFQIQSFLSYWLEAVDDHSLHSPFFYDFYKTVKKVSPSADFSSIEALRKKLLHDDRMLEVQDMGRPSDYFNTSKRKIKDVARTSLTPEKYAQLYNRLLHFFQARHVLELGTSFGINTLYLAQKKDATIHTFEGVHAIAEVARITFEFAGATNIRLLEGDINFTLPRYLSTAGKVDAVFMDANHHYAPTKKYFDWLIPHLHERSILIIDDIHSSKEMSRAWTEIRQHKLVYGTADLFRCGLTFFDPSLNKQHAVLQF